VTDAYVHTIAAMGTVVSFQVVGHGATDVERAARDDAIARAVTWFEEVEATCSRFDPQSELQRLSATSGVAVHASPMLFETLRFALAVAAESEGAFDPTIGLALERRGFDREYRTGVAINTPIDAPGDASYRDVELDDDEQTITLHRPLLLDLGAVAKGLAIDIAARELQPFENFAIDAGGDLYFGGHNAAGREWSVGIRHPRDDSLIDTIHVSDVAVCTSGDYERHTRAGHHLLDPRTGAQANAAASVTVLAPSAMVADTLATSAFVLGPIAGIALLERHGVEGLIVTPNLERFSTPNMPSSLQLDPAERDVVRQR
jgi:FAD:protein FMN transferase